MKLHVLGDYHNGAIGATYFAGQIIDVADAVGQFLLRDAPDNFSRELPLEGPSPARRADGLDKALDAPPLDKMVKKPARKK